MFSLLDVYMLLKRNSPPYPNPSFSSFFVGFSVVVPTLFFWFYLFFAPIFFLAKGLNLYRFSFSYPIELSLMIIGIALMSIGLVIACLGRIARGAYLAKNEKKLIISLGHAIVRHPEYFMYIISFFALPLITLSPYTLILLIGIPGYIALTKIEEKALLAAFGDEYKKYMKRVGRFFPKFSKK